MRMGLNYFLNFSGSKTSGTNLDGFILSINQCLHLDKIRFPDPSACIMSMTDIIAGNSPFSTYITFSSHYIPTLRLYTGGVRYQNFSFM
jgi:hypothetical protein